MENIASLAFLRWLNVQVDFSGRLLSTLVRLSGHQFANFSHFRLLENFWVNLKQTLHKAALIGMDSSLYKWRNRPLSNGR